MRCTIAAVLLVSLRALAEEPDVVPLDEGEKAPYFGFLFSPGRAEKMATKLESCEVHRDLDAQLATDKAKLQIDAANAKLALTEAASADREKLLTQALEAARAEAKRPWWEDPNVVLGVGVVAGVGITVGAVLLVGQLRPVLPTN